VQQDLRNGFTAASKNFVIVCMEIRFSQRPVAFKVQLDNNGLFQTYQFNLMQQVFRHIETEIRNRSQFIRFAIFSIWFQGLPGFQALNTHM